MIGVQVDNEPGLELFHNHGVFQRFVDSLRRTYGNVETLNREWGLVYWSHRLSTWADLWTPDGNVRRVRRGLAAVPGRADRGVHRLAGRPRPGVRPSRAVRDHVHRLRASGAGRPRAGGLARRHVGQRLLPDAGRAGAAGHADPSPVLDEEQHLGDVPHRRPDVLLPPGAVPGHGDQRDAHRFPVAERARLRRAVASGRVVPGVPRCADDRVLALAHAALRRGDVLGWRAAPQRSARDGPTGRWRGWARSWRRPAVWWPGSPRTPTSRCFTRCRASG